METKVREKRGLAAIFALCPKRHALLLLSAALIALHLLTRRNCALMSFLSQKAVRPIHRLLGRLNAPVPFSVAELLLAAAVIAALVYIMYQLVQFFRRAEKGKRLYRTLVTLISAVCSVYALFCLLWGVYYYGEDFAAENGFSTEPVSVEQLASVTRYFARGANRYGAMVARDENGLWASDRAAVLAYAAFVIAGCVGARYLILSKKAGDDQKALEQMDFLSYRLVSFGFLFLTVVILSGAIWAEQAWSAFWTWDPKEVWALICWILYAVYLHLRLRGKKKDRQMAWYLVIAVFVVFFTFAGVNTLLHGLHTYG